MKCTESLGKIKSADLIGEPGRDLKENFTSSGKISAGNLDRFS